MVCSWQELSCSVLLMQSIFHFNHIRRTDKQAAPPFYVSLNQHRNKKADTVQSNAHILVENTHKNTTVSPVKLVLVLLATTMIIITSSSTTHIPIIPKFIAHHRVVRVHQ